MVTEQQISDLDASRDRLNAVARLAANRLNRGDVPGAMEAAGYMERLRRSYAARVHDLAQTTIDEILTESTPS